MTISLLIRISRNKTVLWSPSQAFLWRVVMFYIGQVVTLPFSFTGPAFLSKRITPPSCSIRLRPSARQLGHTRILESRRPVFESCLCPLLTEQLWEMYWFCESQFPSLQRESDRVRCYMWVCVRIKSGVFSAILATQWSSKWWEGLLLIMSLFFFF